MPLGARDGAEQPHLKHHGTAAGDAGFESEDVAFHAQTQVGMKYFVSFAVKGFTRASLSWPGLVMQQTSSRIWSD